MGRDSERHWVPREKWVRLRETQGDWERPTETIGTEQDRARLRETLDIKRDWEILAETLGTQRDGERLRETLNTKRRLREMLGDMVGRN